MTANESSPAPRFMPLEGVQEVLSISRSQAYALVRSGELRAIQVGGRGQWRVEHAELEAYIQRCYAATAPADSQSHDEGSADSSTVP
ncbi:hypothetical protein GCM10009592_30240 [Brachybacterium rhamnosum]|uniref:Helix-turn-helix domain-containing protein n=1 Tax=Brachybacterium rhamnosum TaxID=173361 RepID=A0ABW4Q2B7_9MICO